MNKPRHAGAHPQALLQQIQLAKPVRTKRLKPKPPETASLSDEDRKRLTVIAEPLLTQSEAR